MARVNYLFVYSGWLDEAALKRELPEAEYITTGFCEDYSLSFADYTDDEGKMHQAGTRMVKSPDEKLYGAVWKISEKELYHVDELLNLHEGAYRREYRAVMGENGRPYAVIAHSVKNPCKPTKASADEAKRVLSGVEKYGFPQEYREALKSRI